MKNYIRKFTAALLVFAMVVSTITPAALAAPASDSDDSAADAGEFTLSATARRNIEAAKIVSSLGLGVNGESAGDSGKESKAESAVKDAIFNGYNDTTDLSDYNISSMKMDAAIAEVLEANNMTGLVNVTYETDSEGTVTTAEVEMDAMVTMAAEELEENAATVYNLTEEQSQQLLGMYAQYVQLCTANADVFGVQVPYNTTKDTNANPIGSLLDIADITPEAIEYGYVGFDVLSGLLQLYYLGTQFTVADDGFKDEIKAGRNEALATIEDGMSTVQKYMAINEWLAANCTFAMDYIMEEMVQPEPSENPLYTYAYNCMYNVIYQQVYDGTYDALVDAYGEDQAKAIAESQAKSYMADVQEEGGSGAQQAASTASAITGLWGSNQVGVFVGKKAVCFGYANVYAYLLQCANPDIYLKDGATDLDVADNWKSYEELNYKLDDNGDPVKDENGDYVWSKDSAAIADYVKIKFDADVTMFGQDSTFGEVHYWNAVRVGSEWYYVDPCYIDIYVECMNRDRVETDGNLNNLYFLFSDDTCRDMYDGNIDTLYTLYEGIATDTSYEHTWFSYAKSHTYRNDGKIYYFYDSTDLINIMKDYGNGSSGTSRAAEDGVTDYEGLFTDTEYKLVYHNADEEDSNNNKFFTLIDFNNGQVYNPNKEGEDGTTGALEDNALIAELYEEHQAYVEEYPSISISCAFYEGKLYFSLSNCILSYDLETGAVEKLIEYTEVSGERDMSQGLGGMAFTMASNPGDNGITVKNPPLADMTIKPDEDGNPVMYVSIATRYAFISGKDFGDLKDYSSYGYKFAESNYNPAYNAYYNSDEANDNDEFMWCANIVGTIPMSHLTGSDHSYANVTVPASCTEDEYTVSRCSTCGKIESSVEVEEEAPVTDAGDDEGEGSTDEGTAGSDETVTETAVAALNIKVTTGEDETAQTLASTTLTASGVKGESTDFSQKAVEDAVGGLELPGGYTLPKDYAAQDVTVAYGSSDVVTVTAKAPATVPEIAVLNIDVQAGEGDAAQTLASTTLTAVKKAAATDPDPEEGENAVEDDASEDVVDDENSEVEKAVFTEEKIKEAVDNLGSGLPENYELAAYEYKDVEVDYGASASVTVSAAVKAAEEPAEPEEATSTLTIKVFDSAADKETADPIKEETIDKTGTKGETVSFTAEEIKDKVGEIKGYTLDESSLPTEDITTTYGTNPDPVTLTATAVVTGTGHRYVKFDETYYTKDDNGNWQTGTSYVCVDCGHAFELEDDETTADHLRSNDKLYATEEEIAELKGEGTTEIWTWSTDGTEASLYEVPTDLVDNKFDCVWENTAISTRTVAKVTGNCVKGFTAEANGKTDSKSFEEDKKHSYANQEERDAATGEITQEAAVKWTWADDCSSAEVSFTCDICGGLHTEECSDDCGHVHTETVLRDEMTSSESGATCTESASVTYTATVTVDDVNYISSRTVENPDAPATGHTYDEDQPSWSWEQEDPEDENSRVTGATASFTCSACGDVQTVEAEITKKLNRKTSTTTYIATVTFNEEEYTAEKTVNQIFEEDGNPFEDVDEDDYYYDAVMWALDNGITTGYDATHFAPKDNCKRADVVTFLWRTMGKPEPTITENPFDDIPEDEYYYKAVLWAYENNITKGYDATHFAPNDTVTRAQFVTFIYRQKGEPSYTTENPFEDVKEGEYYYDAVLWAYENGITTGYDATHFAPDDNCIRGDIVTFLYRTYGQDEE